MLAVYLIAVITRQRETCGLRGYSPSQDGIHGSGQIRKPRKVSAGIEVASFFIP